MTALDRETLARAVRRGDDVRFLFFWGHTQRGPALGPACLSQWYPARFALDGAAYATAEHWMMAEKARLFGDAEAEAAILAAPSPSKAKALGREVRGYVEARWEAHRFDAVVRGNVAKFGQDEDLRRYLLGTGDLVLVEASPTDRVWGIGLAADHPDAKRPDRWRGRNLLGFALCAARARLRAEDAAAG